MSTFRLPQMPKIPASLLARGGIPVVFMAALTGPVAHTTLERLEGNVLQVYADHLAGGIPTYCAGRTDWKAPVGEKLTDDECREVNKTTILEYGFAMLECANWDHLTANRLIALTMFAINVGKRGACGSRAVKLINAGQVAEGCRAIARGPAGEPVWSFAGNKYVPGLQNRRQAESALCVKP